MKKPMMKGIDISHWNNVKDYAAIKNSGIDFVIIKAGGNEKGKFYKDVKFDDHYRECRKAGLHVGAYYYAKPSYTGNAFIDADDDAVHFLTLLVGKSFDMPIYLDFEEGDKKRKTYNSEYCYNFCKILEKSKAFIGIYGSDISTFHDMLRVDKSILAFSWWVARYGTEPKYATQNLHMHQYSSKGYVPGIVGNVDMNNCYREFPSIIFKGGYNDFTV